MLSIPGTSDEGKAWWLPKDEEESPRRPRLRLRWVGLTLAVVVAVPAVVYAWRLPPRLHPNSEFAVQTDDAYAGTVYGVGVTLTVSGKGSVTIVSAKVRHLDRGLRQLPALVGYNCAEGLTFPIDSIGADINREPNHSFRVVEPKHAHLKHSADDPCWYLLLRFVPESLGTLHATGGEVTYTALGIRHRLRFDFQTTLVVTHVGHDPRDKTS